ncbi:ATG18, partial [Symbiodinium necroappetens]
MSAQSRQETTRQAGRPSILEGEAAGPTYGAAGDGGEGGNRQSAMPNGVPLRLQNAGVRSRDSGDIVERAAATQVDASQTGPGATTTRGAGEAVQQRAHESVVRRELFHVQHAEPAYDEGGSEVIQRRVVGPVMEQVQTAGRPTTPTAPLMSQEMRRQAEESSNGSISQEVVMEEVKRQVKAALDERESEMKRLHDENQELRQVVMALADRELGVEGGGQSSGALMDGDMGLRGSEPRGNP